MALSSEPDFIGSLLGSIGDDQLLLEMFSPAVVSATSFDAEKSSQTSLGFLHKVACGAMPIPR